MARLLGRRARVLVLAALVALCVDLRLGVDADLSCAPLGSAPTLYLDDGELVSCYEPVDWPRVASAPPRLHWAWASPALTYRYRVQYETDPSAANDDARVVLGFMERQVSGSELANGTTVADPDAWSNGLPDLPGAYVAISGQ